MQTHSWYIENACKNYAFVGQLLSDDHSGKELHNAKISFAAGLAYGFGRKTIMLAHEPYTCPLDYTHLMRKHSTSVECETYINRWLIEVNSYYLKDQQNDNRIINERKNIDELKSIDLGEYIAEQEIDKINDYFVETAAYREAFNSEYALFVGRKGSGKSAILYRLENELSKDNRNYVCIIKPVSYDLDGLIDILKSISGDAEKGFLIESIWKYLIYTEIAKSIYNILEIKPTYYEPVEQEFAVKKMIDENRDIFLDDFSSRLEQIINKFVKIDKSSKGLTYKKNVSEILHENLLSKLREMLYKYFSDKNRIMVLIDNLDKNWKLGENILYLSDFLLGLLSVTNRIADDFTYEPQKKKRTRFSIIVFLRMDIFSYIYKQARERDKLKYSIISWDDLELLLLLIEERFKTSTGIYEPSIIWEKYFPTLVEGVPIKKYFLQNILPRPRDIIFFIKYALANATTRKHNKIQENDIIDAQQRYSQHAVESLIVENGVSIENFERILYEFVGCTRVISRETIEKIIERAGVTDINTGYFIQILCERCFLGRKIASDEYRYQTNFLDNEKIEILASRFLDEEVDKTNYFEINKPFRKFLEIDDK
jgi:DNA replication protein DnaC